MAYFRHSKTPKELLFFVLGLLLISPALFPLAVNTLELPLKSEGSLVFYVDICRFEGRDGRSTVEIIYSLDISPLSSRELAADTAEFAIRLQLLNTLSQVLIDINETKSVAILTPEEGGSGDSFVDLKRFSVSPDTVQLYFTISDSRSNKKGFVNTAFVVEKFSEQFSLSDLLFVSHVRSSKEESNFARHGVLMVPNPARFFRPSPGQRTAFIYFEINNLSFDTERPSAYSLSYLVEDLSGAQISAGEQQALPVSGPNTSRIEKLDISALPSGSYRFKLRATDLKSGETRTSRRYFRVYADSATASLLPMSKKDVQKYYDQIKYIASEEEKKIYKSLDSRAKQEFLLQFWKSRDPIPETPENEFMEEHFSRIAYCEEHFKNGINSDMGRIYILYGPPLDIRRIFSSTEYTKPVEIWVYAIEGRSEFVFVDRMGGDQYVLVHSTHPYEFSNPDWEKDIE